MQETFKIVAHNVYMPSNVLFSSDNLMISTSWIIARRWEQNQAGDSSYSRLQS